MTTQPHISVIAPVYNVERYFERFLNSLFSQTLREGVEFIIVDDCTTDNSMMLLERVLEAYPDRRDQVHVLHNPHNMGLTYSRNAGLRAAQGKYIYHCDSADWFDECLLEALYTEAERTQADIVMCDAEMVHKDRAGRYTATDWTEDKISSLNAYINSEWTVVWNMLVRRDLYEHNNILSPEGITQCEDFHLSVRLCYCAKKIVHLNKSLYFYNRANISSMTNDWSEKRVNSELKVYDDIIEFFEVKGVYKDFKEAMYWRILRAKLPYLLNPSRHKDFLAIHPESHKYILSCPYYHTKTKLISWVLTHNMQNLAKSLTGLLIKA